jgi:hypothetical protein
MITAMWCCIRGRIDLVLILTEVWVGILLWLGSRLYLIAGLRLPLLETQGMELIPEIGLFMKNNAVQC